MGWDIGDVIVQRQVWRGTVILGMPTIVIEATDAHVVTYVAPGAPLGLVEDVRYPSQNGRHPWYGKTNWEGHGMVAITPRTGHYSVHHYWAGPDREFVCWYLNIQEPMRPTAIGFDTQDLELDLVVMPDGSWLLKDDDLLEQRVADGRWTADEVAAIRRLGASIIRDDVEPGEWWWDRKWAEWEPDDSLRAPDLPPGWEDEPVTPYVGLLSDPTLRER